MTVVDLDEVEGYARIDPADALRDVEQAANQWATARAAAEGVLAPLDLVDQVVVCGMGGSGIVADVVVALADASYDLPVIGCKSPRLPVWAGASTLVVAVSYSGDTAETLAAVTTALDRGSPVIGVTSGGRLEALLDDHDQTVVGVPGGGQPRHSTGSLLVPVLTALELDVGLDAAIDRLADVAGRSGRSAETATNPAKQLALRLAGPDTNIPAVYGTDGVGAVAAYRLRCQLAENAKMRATHHTIPEANHNEVVGWDDLATRGGVVWITEDPLHHRRVEVLQELFADAFVWQSTVAAEGEGPLERYASLVGMLDLASVYTALARGIDPTPVKPIDDLKAALAR